MNRKIKILYVTILFVFLVISILSFYKYNKTVINTSNVNYSSNKLNNNIPTISLKGYQSITLNVGDTYFEPGYEAYIDGTNITDNVNITGIVNTNRKGKYKLVYTAKYNDNIVSTDRIINVVDNRKTIYLTLDNGPSDITKQILEILNKENIKATFFITNTNDKYNYLIKEIYNNNHTIGLLSYSNNYKTIYKSVNSYFDDLNLINNKVKKITGNNTNIIRFPYGSFNTISNFNKGIMTKLSILTKDKGYIYYDWNIDSNDMTYNKTSNSIYKDIVKQLKNSNSNTNIILMHDIKNNNKIIKVINKIIKYGKDNGYKFDKITANTPQIKRKINN